LFIYLFLTTCTFTTEAQQPEYNIEYITIENGLPSDGIKGLQWDEKNGFLWVATENGLVRFNGNSLNIFNKINVKGLIPDMMFPLSKDINGKIFAFNKSSLFSVNENNLVSLKTNPLNERYFNVGLLSLFVSNVPKDASKIRVNDYYDTFLPLDPAHCIIQSNDSLWMYKSGNTEKTFLTKLHPATQSFMIGSDIFIYDNKKKISLYDLRLNRFEALDISNENAADDFQLKVVENIYWQPGMEYPVMIAGTNAWQLKYERGRLIKHLICTEIPKDNFIKYVQYWEKGEILFLGTASKGVMILRKNYITTVKKSKLRPDLPNSIYSQLLLSNGNVLVNTGEVLGSSSSPVKNKPIMSPFNKNTFTTRDSVLWYTSQDSLYHYNYKTNKRGYFGRIAGSINLGFAESGEDIYIASSNGIYRIGKDSLISVFKFKNTGDIFDMVESQPGTFMLAAANGLYKFNISKKIFDTILKSDFAFRTLLKYKSYIFIGSYGNGIYIWKNGVLKKIPLDNNGYLDFTHCFILDSSGDCWMSTNHGLLKASLEDMLSAFDDNIQYIYYQFFGKNEGMGITEMNGGCSPCGIWLPNNDISFPTMDGLLWIDPHMPVRFPNGKIFIDEIFSNGIRVDSSNLNQILFEAGTSDISFSIGFSAWCDKENVSLQYRLEPTEKEWQKLDILHPVIHLNNLPHGKYDLYIREFKGFGKGNYTLRKINFEIKASWYLTWWGLALLSFFAVSVVTFIAIIANRRSLLQQHKLRNQLDKKTKEILEQNEKLEKNDLIKTRLISIISHDIITPLKFLHITSKYLSDEKKALPETLRNTTLNEIVNTSRELELLSTNILNWIKYQNEERRVVKESINLHDMIAQIFLLLGSLANKNNITLVNTIPDNMILSMLGEPIRIIIYNLTVNAINFTREGSITVASKYIAGNVQIEVKDTGSGMTLSQIKNLLGDQIIISSINKNKKSGHGLGYLIIKDLLKMINGNISIESKINMGTSVYILFPATLPAPAIRLPNQNL
jgi:signal transduction histidine kinase